MSATRFLATFLILPLLLHSSSTEWAAKSKSGSKKAKEDWNVRADGRLGDLYWNTSNPM